MAIKIKAKAKAKKSGAHISDNEVIIDRNMLEFARANYYEYGMAVLEDRAIPDFRDGNIPVSRRILYSAYDMGVRSSSKIVKAARVVGDAMGRFHPHGDASIYGAMINMAKDNSPIALLDGRGNWGSMSDPKAAAMRYTEMRLSAFSDAVLFNKFYMPIVEYVPNYDGGNREPIILPALLPIILLNGKFGIAPGATSYIPICTPASILKMMKEVYAGEEVTAKFLYKTLKFTSVSGGVEERPIEQEDKLARLGIFKGTKGTATLKSESVYNEKTRTLTITKYANHWKIENLLQKLIDIEGVLTADDDTSKTDKYAVVTVVLRKNLAPKMEKAILKHIENKLLTTRENYVMNFTERYIDEEGQAAAKMHPMSMVDMLKAWFKWRTELERKACAHWIAEADKQIRRLELLMMAVDNLDVILKMLKTKMTRAEMAEHLKKKLKITVEDAQIILELRVYQLNALEKTMLQQQKKEIEVKRNDLKARRKAPAPYMLKQLDEFKSVL